MDFKEGDMMFEWLLLFSNTGNGVSIVHTERFATVVECQYVAGKIKKDTQFGYQNLTCIKVQRLRTRTSTEGL